MKTVSFITPQQFRPFLRSHYNCPIELMNDVLGLLVRQFGLEEAERLWTEHVKKMRAGEEWGERRPYPDAERRPALLGACRDRGKREGREADE
jgi:hypothetical protein